MAMDSGAILQQIEGLLAQLAQQCPEPEAQRAIQNIQKQVEPLQQVLGAQDVQNMQSGLQNPGAHEPAGAGGEEELPEPTGSSGEHGGHPALVIHIGSGGPKDFASAKKAAMATHAERGHFDRGTPAGEEPSTPRTKMKARG